MKVHKSFAALIFVTETEREAVMRMYNWSPITFEGDSQLYFKADTQKNDMEIIAAQQDEMGMTASATLTMKLIEHFHPEYVIMPGIAAGTMNEDTDEQMYGDVVLADLVWNYSNGKYVPKDKGAISFGEVGFQPRPTSVRIDSNLLELFEKAVSSNKTEEHVHIGPMASGSTVVAREEWKGKHTA